MIFCSKCINYYSKGRWKSCDHPLNITIEHNWEREWRSHIKEPKEINRKNDCKWFKPKEG